MKKTKMRGVTDKVLLQILSGHEDILRQLVRQVQYLSYEVDELRGTTATAAHADIIVTAEGEVLKDRTGETNEPADYTDATVFDLGDLGDVLVFDTDTPPALMGEDHLD